MMKNRSKDKGNNFEREIAKKLSLWWTNNEKDDCFYRSINSGGFYTNRKNKGKLNETCSADIVSTSEDTKIFSQKFSVECKHYKDVNIWSIITGTNDLILQWWNKLKEDCLENESLPLLIIRQNNKPIIFLCDETTCNKLGKFYGNQVYPKVQFFNDKEMISIYLLDELLNSNVEYFKILLEEL